MKHHGYTYPWNVHDPSAFVDSVRELGLAGVNIAVSYHAGKFIHPGDRAQRVCFPEDGTVYFKPASTYGKLQPQMASMLAAGDVVDEICGQLPTNAWMVLGHNSRLGFAHPECVVRSAFGDPYYYSLCPANPDVRHYAVAMAADFAASYEVESLLLETPGYLTYAHGYHHEFAQIEPNPYLDMLLGLCFCDCCIEGAKASGIDADGLKQAVVQAIDAYLSEEVELGHDDGLARLEETNATLSGLSALHSWRCDQVTTLVADIRAAVRPEVAVRTIATCQRPHAMAYLEGMDLPALATVADGIECPLYQPDVAGLQSDLVWLTSEIDCSRASAILRPAWPDWSDEDSFRAAYAVACGAGFERINFYNLGMLRPANRRWLQRLLTE